MPFKKGFLSRAPFPVTFQQQVVAASILTTNCLFGNMSGGASAGAGEIYEVLEVEAVYDVLSTSGTLDLRNVPTLTAMTGGTSILTAVMALSGTARTVRKGSLATNRNTLRIGLGSYLSAIFAGTMTGLVGLQVTVWLQAMRGIRGR